MKLNDYQKQAMTTCTETSNNLLYMLLNLQGEVGEFSSKIAKAIRKGKLAVAHNLKIGKHKIQDDALIELNEELKKEAGDILWQLSGLCTVMGWTLEDVATTNLNKLASRKERGVIVGSGDNR